MKEYIKLINQNLLQSSAGRSWEMRSETFATCLQIFLKKITY